MLDSETARQVKWHHAMNPRPIQKLANMQMRMDEYRAEMRRFVFVDMMLMAVVGAAVVFPAVYLLPGLFSAGDAHRVPCGGNRRSRCGLRCSSRRS
jgi:hypothetical protein